MDKLSQISLPDVDISVSESNDTEHLIEKKSSQTTTVTTHTIRESGHQAEPEIKGGNTQLSWYLQRDQKAQIRLTINALSRSQTEDKPGARDTIKGKDDREWHSDMWTKIRALQQPDC